MVKIIIDEDLDKHLDLYIVYRKVPTHSNPLSPSTQCFIDYYNSIIINPNKMEEQMYHSEELWREK